MTTTFLPTVLFLLLLNNLLLLGAPRLPALIRLTAFQGILLAVLLLCLDHALLAGAVLLRPAGHDPVSYTHLTLPTICSV